MDPKQSDALARVAELVRYLRTHCPWDAAQTPRSLVPYLLEEAHETADAIADDDDDALRSELGDLLLNVAFQLVLAEERAAFSADQVADAVIGKMQRRHPHLFGLGEKQDWETLKAKERPADAGILHGVARGLDPLSRAHRIQDRVSTVGFDWADHRGALAKVAEELEEVREQLEDQQQTRQQQPRHPGERRPLGRPLDESEEGVGRRAGGMEGSALEEELGDLLFAVVNLTRLAGAHPLTALQRANAKFARRFEALERRAAERGIVLRESSLEELDTIWDEVKAEEENP